MVFSFEPFVSLATTGSADRPALQRRSVAMTDVAVDLLDGVGVVSMTPEATVPGRWGITSDLTWKVVEIRKNVGNT